MIGRSLKSQLTLITVLPMLITLIFISVLFLQQLVSSLQTELDNAAKDISDQATLLSEFYLYTGDIDGLTEVSNTLLSIDRVNYIRFIDNSGQLLISNVRNNELSTVHYSFPIYSQQIDIGDFGAEQPDKVRLGTFELGLSRLHSLSREYASYKRLIIIAFASVFLGLGLVFLFSRSLSKALENLTQTATQIENGDTTARCDEYASGELLELQKMFNTMAQTFEENEQTLKAKVDEATQSLSETIEALSEKNVELDNTRQAAIELERSKAILEERERIMRDMHDGIGGQLVASIAMIERENESQMKTNVLSVLSECLADLRLIIHSLSMPTTVLSELLADFKYRISRRLEKLDIDLEWSVCQEADQIDIKPQNGLNLLRILQESFTNTLKHAEASSIHFEVTALEFGYKITIEDNGHFTPPKDPDYIGHGLRNMITRAGKMGAEISIEQGKSNGCLVTLTISEPPP